MRGVMCQHCTGKDVTYFLRLDEAMKQLQWLSSLSAVPAVAQSKAHNNQDIMRASYIHRNVRVWRASSNIADKCVLLFELPADPVWSLHLIILVTRWKFYQAQPLNGALSKVYHHYHSHSLPLPLAKTVSTAPPHAPTTSVATPRSRRFSGLAGQSSSCDSQLGAAMPHEALLFNVLFFGFLVSRLFSHCVPARARQEILDFNKI